MHPVNCALLHDSGLSHANCHPSKMPGHSLDTDDSPRRYRHADDIGLLSSKHQDAQQKAEHLSPIRSRHADDIGLLSSKHQDAQQKAEHLSPRRSRLC